MEANQRVRVIADPGRVGRLTGKVREAAGKSYFQIEFPDGASYLAQDQIEPAQEPTDLFDLLRRGELGRATDLRRLLTHVRMGGKLANLIYSMETTNTDFYAYQFKPVLKLLETPTKGILIADEVGLGKTIEAGLIWTELRCRVEAHRLMVVCPSMLREKWRSELSRRFGIQADVLNADETLQKLRWALEEQPGAGFHIVSSIQGLRPRRGWEEEDAPEASTSKLAKFLQDRQEDVPIFDLLVIDEAHYLRNPETKTHELGELLAGVSDRVLFLSATPIHLKNEDLFQLLSLLDPDTFNSPELFDSILEANAPIVSARELILSGKAGRDELAKHLLEARESPYLADSRQLAALLDSLPSGDQLHKKEVISEIAHRLDSINLLSHAVTRTRKREVTEWRVLRLPVPEKVPMTPAEEQFYLKVTQVIRDFCRRYEQHEGFLLCTPQRQMSSSMPAALRSWKRRQFQFQEQAYEDLGQVDSTELAGPVVQELVSRLDELGSLEELWQNDSKFARLAERLTAFFRGFPNEKVVVFSYFKDTLRYLAERLGQLGISNIVLSGDQGLDKDEILEQFADPVGPSVLLSSEIGSEGVDLQFCRVMVNYDLPWNPMRVEQRIGRLDRIGQKAEKILVWNLMYDQTIDSRIYDRLFVRLQIFERALGGLEAVLGDEIRKLTDELMRGDLTPAEEEHRIEQTAQAIVIKRNLEDRLEQDAASLVGHADYILNQIRAAKELNRWISGEDIKSYVLSFLRERYPGCVFEQTNVANSVDYRIALSNEAKHDLERFIRDRRIPVTTALTRYDSAPVPCRFENRVASEHPGRGPEHISQFHPLVRFVAAKLSEDKVAAYPVASVALSQFEVPDIRPGQYVFAVQRWTVEGLLVREMLKFLVMPIIPGSQELSPDATERLIVTASLKGQDWLAARNLLDLSVVERAAVELCFEIGRSAYEHFRTQVVDEMADRATLQRRTIERHVENQKGRYETLMRSHRERAQAAQKSGDRLTETRFENLARAVETNLEKLLNRFERELIRITKGTDVHVACDDMCVGVILVQ